MAEIIVNDKVSLAFICQYSVLSMSVLANMQHVTNLSSFKVSAHIANFIWSQMHFLALQLHAETKIFIGKNQQNLLITTELQNKILKILMYQN